MTIITPGKEPPTACKGIPKTLLKTAKALPPLKASITNLKIQKIVITTNDGIIDSNGAETAGGTAAGILILIPLLSIN